MSVPVPLDDLPAALAERAHGYLLSVGDDGAVKAVSAVPTLADGVIRVPAPGRGSCANASRRPAVTLLWPPVEPGGHTLLVDGTGEVRGDDVVVIPHSAVLHRSADHG